MLNCKQVLYEVIGWDALAVYSCPKIEDYANKMNLLFEMKFTTSEEWINEVLNIYRMVIISAADGDFFKVYTFNESDFQVLQELIKRVEQEISLTSWYQKNKSKLVWGEKYNCCLVFPEILRNYDS